MALKCRRREGPPLLWWTHRKILQSISHKNKYKVKHNFHDALQVKKDKGRYIKHKTRVTGKNMYWPTVRWLPMWLGFACDSVLLVIDRYATRWASVSHSTHEVTGFSKDDAAAVLLLPWSLTLCIIMLPHVRCTFRDHFLQQWEPHMHNMLSDTTPLMYKSPPPRVDTYHAMFVIRIGATPFHKGRHSSHWKTGTLSHRIIVWLSSFRPF